MAFQLRTTTPTDKPKDPRLRIRIGTALNIYSLTVAVLPVLVVVAIAVNLFSQQARNQRVDQMTSIAESKSQEIQRWLDTSQTILRLILTNPEQYRRMSDILLSRGRTGPQGDSVRLFLQDQLELQDAFTEFFIYNLRGDIRISTNPDQEAINIDEQNQPYFEAGLEGEYIQPPYIDPVTGQIEIVITAPISNTTNDIIGVLAGRLSVETLNSIMTSRIGLGETGETYLISGENSNFITASRFETYTPQQSVTSEGISRVLQGFGRNNQPVAGSGFYDNYRGQRVIGVYRYIPQLESGLLAEIEESEALATVQAVQFVSVVAAATMAIIALALGRFVTVWITRPINRLTRVAEAVMTGDYTQRAGLAQISEIGQLGQAFDTMTNTLVDSLNERNRRIRDVERLSATLEQRVAARTRDLKLAADVSRQITTILDIEQLLQEVVKATVQGFDLYCCFVLRYDEQSQMLNRVAGADENGNPVSIDELAHIPLDAEPSVIAAAARRRRPVTVNDVTKSTIHMKQETLPDTRSELSVPIMLGDQLLGVFDVQSREVDRFDDNDVAVLTSLAEQIAVALRNAQLFTEAQKAREEAEEANRVKSQFLANMSHELRTPLNAILNFAEFMVDGDLGEVNDEQVDALNKVISSGEHLLSLINDVLDITKIEVGMLELFIEEVDINATLKSVLSTGKGLVKDRPVELYEDIQPDLPKIQGDRRRLRQVFLNLLSNAVKFTPQGSVTITAKLEGEEIIISVKDTGVGIPPEDQDAVFESFRQSEGGREFGGTGLGLPISKHFVEAHGGRVWLESEVGKGTTFYVALPVSKPEVDEPQPETEQV
ncbi:MAG: hypothetical protein CUN56_01390 [Phototrophicales bacterium]|nr:MAG: hypothetical protein CUN56_01390 [Phototrophicales bacterium]RMG74716.1 MAG: GAF domain-containing protein [Chloroflexota bacterium]